MLYKITHDQSTSLPRNVAIYITHDYIVRQTENLAFIIKMSFTILGQSILGQTVPSVLSIKTSGTVFPNMDLPGGE